MAKHKPAWKFQYVGPGEVTTGLQKIERGGKEDDHPGVLIPGDVVVVADPDERDWLRSLTNFQEQESPTSDKPTHHRAPAKKKPANGRRKKPEGGTG